MTSTKWKLFSLLALYSGFLVVTACGDEKGGGGGQGQLQCFQAATKCPDGSDAVKTDGGGVVGSAMKGSCAYACGSLALHTGVLPTATTTATATASATPASTITDTATK